MPMLISAMPFEGYEVDLDESWLDVNDHMNARFYNDVIYDAHVLLTTAIGLGDDYVARTRHGKVVVESHLIYEREVRRNARLGVRSWLLAVDDKRLHFAHELLDLTNGFRAAFAEQLDLHFDLEQRRVAAMPADVRERLTVLASQSKALMHDFPLGRSVKAIRA